MKISTIKLCLMLFAVFSAFGKINAQTTFEWVRTYDEPDKRNTIHDACFDKNGNSYLAGSQLIFQGNDTSEDFLTIKYDKDGNLLWQKTYDSGTGMDDVANTVVLDDRGNVYVAGFGDGVNELDQYVIIKYSPNGEELWRTFFNGPESGGIKWHDHATNICLDEEGNVYVTGTSQELDGNTFYVHTNIATLKLNSSGVIQWSHIYNTPENGDEWAAGIEVNRSGQVYVAGTTSNQNENTVADMLLIMYDKDGNLKWLKRYDGPASAADGVLTMTSDRFGNAYICGYQNDEANTGTADFYIAKYDTAGAFIWSDVINEDDPGVSANWHFTYAIAIDSEDNLYVHAYNTGFENFVAKYDLDGNRKWISFWDGLTRNPITNIAFDNDNNIYVTGDASNGGSDGSTLAAAKFDPSGNKIWVVSYEDGIVNDNGVWGNDSYGVGVDNDGNVYIAGNAGARPDYIFEVVKYSQTATGVNDDNPTAEKFNLNQNYPNPFNPSTTISFSIPETDFVTLIVYNSIGQEVVKLIDSELSAGTRQVQFNAANIPSGTYFYRLRAGNFVQTKKCLLIK